jgi:hypothetical protein
MLLRHKKATGRNVFDSCPFSKTNPLLSRLLRSGECGDIPDKNTIAGEVDFIRFAQII